MGPVYTIGHSARSQEALVDLLASRAIAGVADVRRFPASRRHPQFSAAILSGALLARGMAYRHFPSLGGFRTPRPDSPHVAWTIEAFRGYADHMGTEEFGEARRALEAWAEIATIAVMCAEADPMQCHRQLIADALARDGFDVVHVIDVERDLRHRLTKSARVEGGRLIYDGGAPLELPGL